MASDRATKDKEMAADLKRRGIFPGDRPSKTLADPMSYVKPDLVGTAKYRRYLESRRAGKLKDAQGR